MDQPEHKKRKRSESVHSQRKGSSVTPAPPLLPPPPTPFTAPARPTSLSPPATTVQRIDLECPCQSPRLLPAASIAYASRSVLTDPFAYADALLYGPDLGSEPLRKEVARWLTDYYEPDPGPVRVEDLCITGGASQNLANILQKFTDPAYTRAVWQITPSSHHRCTIFEDNGLQGKLRFVSEDEEGLDIRSLETKMLWEESVAVAANNLQPAFKSADKYPKIYKHIIYCIPTFKNPTSTTLSLRRRLQLLQLARTFDALIIADDAFDLLRWGNPSTEQPIPRLVDLDRATIPDGAVSYGNAVSNASFSILVAPGCRVGWLEGTERFVKTLGDVGSTKAGGAPSQLVSMFVWNLLHTGTLQTHIDRVLVPCYAKRYEVLSAAIKRHLVPLGVAFKERDRLGGWFVWLKLPGWCAVGELAGRLEREHGVVIKNGESFEGGGGRGCVRISLAWEDEERLAEGVRRMGLAMERMKREREGRRGFGVGDLLS